MKIKLPKYGIIYTYHKNNAITAKLGFIKTKYKSYLQSHAILQLPFLEISINVPVAYIDWNGNNVIISAIGG